MSSALSTTNADSDTESRVTKQMIERKQLLHDLELLRIELSQKNLMIDNLKAENLNRVDDLEERVSENRHAKLMLQARLESQLKLQQEESQAKLERMRREINTIMARQRQLEVENERLQEKAGDLRNSLDNLEILPGDKYLELKSTDQEQVSLKDFLLVIMLLFLNSYIKLQL
jgi:progesterone-induced-blocking factor 1